MADEIFYIKRNDTSPGLRYELYPRDVSLVGASVVFNMWDRSDTVKVSLRPAVVITATGTPTVEYRWASTDTNTAGRFRGEFQVQFADGTYGTFPNDDYIDILITEDIA